MKSGEAQNKASERGMVRAKKSAGSESIHSEEHVGGTGPGTHSFRLPKQHEVCDHSNVRGSIGKE
jgi:hypothetical protein